MIRFFHFWFGVFSIFEKAILLQKIYVKFTVEKSFVMGYLKNISSGGYDFEARLRKDYQHLNFAFPQIRMNLCVLVTVGAFWDGLISMNYAQTVTSGKLNFYARNNRSICIKDKKYSYFKKYDIYFTYFFCIL